MINPEAAAPDEFFESMLGNFLEESGQLLDRLNENLLQLDAWVQALDDDHSQRCDAELLNEMFRSAHSLKGLSAMLGLADINKLTHNEVSGRGIGMDIVKSKIEELNGTVGLDSEPGMGTTLTIKLPLTSSPGEGSTFSLAIQTGPSETVSDNGPQPSTGPAISLDCRILLVEDSLDGQRLISLFLKKAGADVTLAENGQVALEKASAAVDPFDLILMDMQMPVMDGYEATRRLRKQGYTRSIIALTAHSVSDDREKCLDAGCDDFLTKPVDCDKLLSTLAQYTEKQLQV